MRDNNNASLAFKLGTDAPRGAIPVISMRYAGVHGARRSVNVTPIGTFAVERAVRLVTSAWRAVGTLLGLICLVSITLRFQVVTILSHGKRGTFALQPATKDLVLPQRSLTYLHWNT